MLTVNGFGVNPPAIRPNRFEGADVFSFSTRKICQGIATHTRIHFPSSLSLSLSHTHTLIYHLSQDLSLPHLLPILLQVQFKSVEHHAIQQLPPPSHMYISVYEDQPSSIIAFALNSREYANFIEASQPKVQ